MTVVVDASVALKWFVSEDDSEFALGLLGSSEVLIAPDLVVARGEQRRVESGPLGLHEA